MNREHILAILYDLATIIGGEVRLRPLLTRSLQRFLYHTSFPAGLVLLDAPGDGAGMQLAAAVGDYGLAEQLGQLLHLLPALTRGGAEVVESPALLDMLPCARRHFRVFLRLPIEGQGTLLLLAVQKPHSALPLTHIFEPVLAQLGRAITLCRNSEAYMAGLTQERDQAREALDMSEERFRMLGKAAPDAIVMLDEAGRVAYWNPAAERLFGYSADETRGRDAHSLIMPHRFDVAFRRGFARFARDGRGPIIGHLVEIEGRRKDGSEFPMELSVSAIQFQGRWHAIGIMRDITERHRAETQLRIAATAFEAEVGIIVTDAEERIIRANGAFSRITGYTPEEAIGQTPRLLHSGYQDTAFYQAMWEQVARDGAWHGEIWNRRANGNVYPEWLSLTAIHDGQGRVSHYVGTLTDITDYKAAERKIENLAFYDVLTQLPNRRLLLDRLGVARTDCARDGRHGALIFVDMDNFKILNDTSGHDVGDQLLIEAARRLQACVRGTDTVARPGGDEFVVMLRDLDASPADAAAQVRAVGNKIGEALSRPYLIDGRPHHCTPSLGVTLFGQSAAAPDELLQQADIAMYQAKSAGRNTLRFYDPDMQASLNARAELEAALREATDTGQFVLHYQAQVSSGHGIVGAEALLRWNRPGHGLVPPGHFIPLVEENGLILPIGEWILRTACQQLRNWASQPRFRHLRLAINVSARQFRQADFVLKVRQALEDTAAPANRLKLELTESMVLDDVEDAIAKMQALRALGVGFSMDDFGTGYSSLAYLTRLPLDQLKIDQSFVRMLPDSLGDAAVVQTIISLTHSLGLAVIAEGVETETQRVFLEESGCPSWQGFLFSRPVPLREFEALLARPHDQAAPLRA